MLRRLVVLTFLVATLLGTSNAENDSALINFLVLNSYHQSLPWTEAYNKGVLEAVNTSENTRYQIYFETLDAARIPSDDRAGFLNYLEEKYQNIVFDAVLSDAAPASELVDQNTAVFTQAKIMFALNDESSTPETFVFSNDKGQFVEKTLDLMRLQNPKLSTLMYIGSGAPTTSNFIEYIYDYFAETNEVEILIEDDFAFRELLQRVEKLPPDSAILYETVFEDNQGNTFIPKEAVRQIALSSAAPVYSTYSTFLDAGIVGGHVQDASIIGRSSVLAATDFIRNGQFDSFSSYPTSETYVDLSLSKVFGLRTQIDLDYVGLNKPENWLEKHVLSVFWGSLTIGLLTCLSFYWLFKLRQINERIFKTNADLRKVQNQLKSKNLELQDLSIKDPLTGLLNRRALIPQLEQAIFEADRYGTHSALMLVDLDDFKRLNDQFGHNTGDMVLKSFAHILQSESRRTDVLSRWGGEEFVILAKGVHAGEAYGYMEKVRQRVQSTQQIGQQPITFSTGICNVEGYKSVDDIIAEADKAMYQAKQMGKNTTVIAEDSTSVIPLKK